MNRRSSDRRRFLKQLSVGAALAMGNTALLLGEEEKPSASEALPGSPRWPESFRARDFYNRCSMGGYFAARGAAFEKRPVAVVLQSAWYDVLEDSYDFCPSFRPHLRYMVGAGSDSEAQRLLRAFHFRGIAEQITGPISIVHGEQDDIVRLAGAKRLYQEISSKEKQFKAVAGARHNLDEEVPRLMDWICASLTS